MPEFKIYLTSLKEIANKSRLKEYYQRQKGLGKPIYYLLPSSKWLQEGRKRQPGLAFKTFDDIADLILKKGNVDYIPVSEGERDLFFQQLLLEEKVTNNLFKAKGYSQTYGQLKRLGLTLEHLPSGLKNLKKYLERYEEEWVLGRKLLDPENRFHQALNLDGIELPLGEVVVDGYIDFSPLQYWMLKGLIKFGINTSVYIPAVESEIVEETLTNLKEIGFSLEKVQYSPKKEPRISIMKGVTIEEEIHGVLEDIKEKLNRGKEFESIGIVLADENYLPMVQLLSSQYRIPLAIPKKSNVLESNLFKTLYLLLRGNSFSSKWDKLAIIDSLYQLSFKSKEDYFLAKEKYLKSYSLDTEIGEKLTILMEFRKKLNKRLPLVEMISLLLETLEGLNFLNLWQERYKGEGNTKVLQRIRFEWLAYQAIITTLKDKREKLVEQGLENLVINLDIFIPWLSQLLTNNSVYLERTPAKGISLYNFREVGLFEGDTLYVMGMNEGILPRNYKLAGYLKEKDLREMPPIYGAPTRSTLKKKDEGIFNQLFYLADNIYFSYTCGFDPENELEPSPFIEEYCKGRAKVKRLTAESRYKEGMVISKEQALEKGAFMLGLGKNVENAPGEFFEILEHIAYLKKGEEILDGSLTTKSEAKIAITALEQYSQCPFRYGMERLLKVKEPLKKEEEISPLSTGTMFHKIVEEFYLNLGVLEKNFSEIEQGVIEKGEEILLSIFEEKWLELEKEYRDIPTYYLELERDKWIKLLKKWWSWEKQIFFDEPLNNQMRIFKLEEEIDYPFPLENGETINLTGKIDRIDVDNNGFTIYDYKTGGVSLKEDEITKGLKLQLPLYIYILEEKIKGGEYIDLGGMLNCYGGCYVSVKNPEKRNKGFWQQKVFEGNLLGVKGKGNSKKLLFNGGEDLINKYNLKEKIKELWEKIRYDYSVKPQICYPSCPYKRVCRVTEDLKEEGENGV